MCGSGAQNLLGGPGQLREPVSLGFDSLERQVRVEAGETATTHHLPQIRRNWPEGLTTGVPTSPWKWPSARVELVK